MVLSESQGGGVQPEAKASSIKQAASAQGAFSFTVWRADEVTRLLCVHPLTALASGYTKARFKDIISKPQFVVYFQGDVALLLNPDVVYECLQTRAKQNQADQDGP